MQLATNHGTFFEQAWCGVGEFRGLQTIRDVRDKSDHGFSLPYSAIASSADETPKT
jgi:hypothetical protein